MKIVKNMLLAFGFLLSGSLVATTEQVQAVSSEVASPSFIDKVKNVEWMTGIDGAKKGFFKGLMWQALQNKFGGKIGKKLKSKLANQMVQELVYQIDQATSNETQGAEYVAENLGRMIGAMGVLLWNFPEKDHKKAKGLSVVDTFKASLQRLCDSSMDDFSSDKKVIARAVFKALLRGLVSLPVIDDQKTIAKVWTAYNSYSSTSGGYYCDVAKAPSYDFCFKPNKQSAALALSNAFFPLLVDGGTKFVNDEFKVVSDKNARRFAGILKAIGRIGVGAALGQNYQK